MNIKIVYINAGQIIGDVEVLNEAGDVLIKDAAFVLASPSGLQLVPVTPFAQESHINLKHSEIQLGGTLFTPITELRNYYSSEFGSGIVLGTR